MTGANKCVLIETLVNTYPAVRYARLDYSKIIAALKDLGVEEVGEVNRIRLVHGGMFASKPREIELKDLWFRKPDDPQKAFEVIQRIEDLLSDSSKGSFRLSNWHPQAHVFFNEAERHAGAFEVVIEDYGISIESRDDGDVAEGQASQETINRMRKLHKHLKSVFPDLPLEAGTTDEWVYCNASFSDMDVLAPKPQASVRPKM